MKKILLLIIVTFSITNFSIGQAWLQKLPQNKAKSELTLKDYQSAFDEYWAPYNVNNNGYYLEEGKEVKAPGWKQFKRWEWNMQAKVDPETGSFPVKSAQQVYDEFIKANPSQRNNKSANWTELGPGNSDGGYAGVGRLNCIAFHPSNNNTYWVGAPAGGLWVTTNNGSSWTCLTDDNAVLGVSDIAIPSDYATSQTIYIATGDRDAWDNRSIGVLKSTNGGSSWNTTGIQYTLAQSKMVTRLLIDPNNDNVIIAATSNGVYKTTNGGSTWSNQLTSSSFIDMEFKPGDFNTLYGSTTNGSIYVSIDGGNNWSENFNQGGRVELAVSPDNSSYVYAVVSNSSSALYGVYRSTNSGSSFSLMFDAYNLLGWASDGSGSSGQGWYDLAIAVSPNDANIVLVGGVNTWKSTNGGSSWSIANHWWGDGVPAVHADKHMLKYRNNGDLFECNDGGVYLSTNNGTSWTDKTNGIVISQMYKLGVSQTVATETITGLQDNGTKLLNGGSWDDVKGGDGMECLIDYSDVNIQYGTYVNGQISRTTNHWVSSQAIEPNNNGAWVTPYIIDPVDHNTLYAGYSNVWKTTDKGNNWTEISTMNTGSKIRAMAISPSNNSVIYVSDPNQIWKTTNGGSSWTEVTGNLPVSSTNIKYISIKSDDPNTVWVALSNYNTHGVYQSTNGGSSWTNISAGLPQIPCYTIVQNTQASSATHLYVGTELGVYFKNGTDTWVEFNDGLPNVQCGELEIYYASNPSNSKLRLASYGRGLWESPLEQDNTDLASVQTTTPTNITTTTATLGGNVTDEGNSSVTERGVVWSSSPNPTTNDNKITDSGTGTGSFTAPVTGLSPSSTYYTRAYAINSAGTSYGSQESFTTNCSVFNLPFAESFESENFPPNCWAVFIGADGVGNTNNWTSSTEAQSGTKAAYVEYENVTGTAEDWMVSPLITLTSGSQLSFYQKQSYSEEYNSAYYVLISTVSQTDPDEFTIIETWTENDFTTSYTEKIIDLSAYDGQDVYIAFAMANDDGDDWFIDNINITGSSSPTPVASVTATPGCTTGSVTVSSDLSGSQTFYLTSNDGTVLDNATVNASFYEFDGLVNGTYRGKVENNGQMSALSSPTTLTNNEAPDQPSSISGETNPCQGNTETYSVSNVSGLDYTWSLPAGWTGNSTSNSITVTIGDASGDVSVTPSNSCGDGPASTVSINVSTIPSQPSSINGNTNVCEGTQETYTVPADANVESYSWTIPNGWTGSSTTNSIVVTVGANDGNITATPSNNCGTGVSQSLALQVTNSGPPQPGEIQGDLTVCSGATETYSVPEDISVDTYTWTLPSGWTGNSTTHTITVTVGSSGGTISVFPSNLCGEGPTQTTMVDVSSNVPSPLDPITGSDEVCEGATETYAVNLVDNIEYTWLLPSGWSGASLSNEITVTVGTGSGDITVTPANGCGAGPSQSMAVNTSLLPEAPGSLNGEEAPCVGTSQTYSVDNQVDVTFNWSIPADWTGGSSNNSITVTVGSASGNITVSASNICGESPSSEITVDPIEVLGNLGNIDGPANIMETLGASYSISAATDADSYQWSLSSNWEIQSGAGSNEVYILFPAGAESGVLTVSAQNECGESESSTKNIEVSPVGMAEMDHSNVLIYPNPSNGIINIELENKTNDDLQIRICSMEGKTVHESQIKSGEKVHQLDLGHLATGNYFIDLENDQTSEKFKLIITK